MRGSYEPDMRSIASQGVSNGEDRNDEALDNDDDDDDNGNGDYENSSHERGEHNITLICQTILSNQFIFLHSIISL